MIKDSRGENNVQLGKTYKLMGTLHIAAEQPETAKLYLQKAHRIFEEKGMIRLKKEVAAQIKSLHSPSSKLFQNEGASRPAIRIRRKKAIKH